MNDVSGSNFNFNVRYGAYYFCFAPFYDDFTGDGKADIAYVCDQLPSGGPSAVSILKGNSLIASQFNLNLSALVQGFYNDVTNRVLKNKNELFISISKKH